MREETEEGVCKYEDGPPVSGSNLKAQFVSLDLYSQLGNSPQWGWPGGC